MSFTVNIVCVYHPIISNDTCGEDGDITAEYVSPNLQRNVYNEVYNERDCGEEGGKSSCIDP